MPQPKDVGWLNGYKNKSNIFIYLLSVRDTFVIQGHMQIESERIKKVFHANENQKKSGVSMFVSSKIDFKTKTVIRDKEGHYKKVKG